MVKRRRSLFKPSWVLTLLTFTAVGLFLGLGDWQLRRAAEKQALLDLQTERLQLPPTVLTGEETLTQLGRYRRVVVTGVWDPQHQFLLDARTRRGRSGYEVLTPLVLDNGRVVLVNRGWLPARGDRRRLPDVSLALRRVTVRGRVDHFLRMGMDLAGMRRPSPGWPAVVQVLEPEVAAARLGRGVADFQVKMDADLPDGYLREWRLEFTLKPQRHVGYALQWFSFAVMALGLWIWHGLKRAREET